MSLVSRLKTGLALVTLLSAATAVVGIQRIVHVTNETTKFDARTDLVTTGLGLILLMDDIEQSDQGRSQLLASFQAESTSFITGLRTIEVQPDDNNEKSVLNPDKLEDQLNQWQAQVQPRWYILKTKMPKSDGKIQMEIHQTVALLVTDVGTRIGVLRNESAGTIRLLALAALAIVLAGLFLMFRLQRQLEDPLDRIEDVLNETLREHLVRRTGIRSDNEFGRIGRKLDRVLTRLEMAKLDQTAPTPQQGPSQPSEPNPPQSNAGDDIGQVEKT